MTESKIKAPAWFWVVSAVALIWNLLGVMAFLSEALSPPEQLIEMFGEKEANAIINRPTWATAVYFVAVFGGVLGCLFLLLRKRLAVAALATSLLAVVIQQAYWWFGLGLAGELSGMQWFMPISILMVAVVLVMFAKSAAEKGWIR